MKRHTDYLTKRKIKPEYGTAVDHVSEPIKDKETIYKIHDWFLYNHKYRDNMMFMIGIYTGLRISDILNLKIRDVIDPVTLPERIYKVEMVLVEKKTRKKRIIHIHEKVSEAIELYLKTLPSWWVCEADDYLFQPTDSPRYASCMQAHQKPGHPIDDSSAARAFNQPFEALNINIKHGTHTMRKTFAYHVLTAVEDPIQRTRRLEVLQKMFNHSSPRITLEYAGITKEEVDSIYENLDYEL